MEVLPSTAPSFYEQESEEQEMLRRPSWEPPKRINYMAVVKLVLPLLAVVLLLGVTSWGLDVITLIMVLFAALAVFAITHVIITVLQVQYENRWGRTRSVPATVLRKWSQTEGFRLPAGEEPEEEPGWWVTFGTETRHVDLQVPEVLFTEVEEGMEGILTYRGERFFSFFPTDESRDSFGEADPSQGHPGPPLP